MNNFINKFEYRQLDSRRLIISEKYQRALDKRRVLRIVANFNKNLVNPIKVSFRDGLYYVFDGQHTLAALKLRNGNNDLMVDCKVYQFLTEEEEAVLFAEQNGLSRQVETIAKFKALYTAGDINITEMVRLTETAGMKMNFHKGKANYKITAVAKAYKIFRDVSAIEYVEIISIIKDAWGGIPESTNTEILGGIFEFHKKYKGQYDRKILVTNLSKVSPVVITREGKVYKTGGDARFAKQILNIYNHKLTKNRLKEDIS